MADDDRDQLESLVTRPTESISVELKSWIDPRTPDGTAKLVKSVFALRNRGGGFLVIGFDDKTGSPDTYGFDDPIETVFHVDAVQALLARHASVPFLIEVHLREREGQLYPVIVVPSGVRVPVVVRADLSGEGGKRLLSVGDLYFRTLRANNTPSSARILPADYPDLMEICFNNREADIGGFVRRQLGQADLSPLMGFLRQALGTQNAASTAPKLLRERAFGVITEGGTKFFDAVNRRNLSVRAKFAIHRLTMEVGLVLDPEKPDSVPTQSFLNLLAGANPQYTGWPIWFDSRGFREERDRPAVNDGAWQALIATMDGDRLQHLDFMRLDPRGAFYLRRAMQDDLTEKVMPGTALDVFLMLIRVAEVLAVGLSFARAAGWEATATAGFAFRWSALEDRELNGWANPLAGMSPDGNRSSARNAESFVSLAVDTPSPALAPYVSQAVGPLFSVFDGYEPPQALVEDAVKRLLERRLG